MIIMVLSGLRIYEAMKYEGSRDISSSSSQFSLGHSLLEILHWAGEERHWQINILLFVPP